MINVFSMLKHTQHRRGQAMIIAVLFFLVGSVIILVGVAAPVVRGLEAVRIAEESRQSFFASESGVDDVMYRVMNAMDVSPTEELVVGGAQAITTSQTVLDDTEIVAVGDYRDHVRRSRAVLTRGVGASFNFGLQSDVGGIILQQSSTVTGNVYSNGSVIGTQDNVVSGDVVSAGSTGLVDGIHAMGSVWAHSIADSEIDQNAYYQTIDADTIVWGTKFLVSSDQETSPLPISDDVITQWEIDAEAGGTIAATSPECAGGTYTIDSSRTIGPVKIECNLTVKQSSTVLTLAGMVWILGNFDTQSGPTIRVDSSLSDKSVALIVDNPVNQITGSKANLEQSTVFTGASGNSYIVLISQNNDAENGGPNVAISANQSSEGDLILYAGHGEIRLEQSARLKEVTGYRIRLRNTAEVTYESGFASVLFTSGPSGGFVIKEWGEVE